MSDFAPGDVVVCVDAVVREKHVNETGPIPIRHGGVYRIQGPIRAAAGNVGVLLEGERPFRCSCCTGTSGWRASRFRKIRSASDEFTRQMRACKPIKQREPVE